MVFLRKLWCFIRGHDMVSEGEMDNGRSKYGAYLCLRCGKNHPWQYDYEM